MSLYSFCLLKAPGIQGLYAQLVGNRGQGMFQSFFFICNYTGRTLGSWAVGWVAQEYGANRDIQRPAALQMIPTECMMRGR